MNRVGIILSLVAYVTQHLSPQQSRDLVTYAFVISNRTLLIHKTESEWNHFLGFLPFSSSVLRETDFTSPTRYQVQKPW